jgi:hypothetical protein
VHVPAASRARCVRPPVRRDAGQHEMPLPVRMCQRGALTPAARRLLDRTGFGGVGAWREKATDRAMGWAAKKD